MTPHTHRTFVDGCFRCELSRDEVMADLTVREHLEAIRDYTGTIPSGIQDHAVAAIEGLDAGDFDIHTGMTTIPDPLPRVSSVPDAPHATKETPDA